MTLANSLPGLEGIAGAVLMPSDEGYDEARISFNGMIDRRPAVIVQPETTDEVAAAVRAARQASLNIAVRGGGHSVAGHGVPDGAMVIDLRRMRRVTVDPDARLARAQGGALWEDVDGATVPHSLYVPGGTFVDTGIGGLTLTGGIGFLMGTGGLTCDNVVGATVVTGDGSIVTAGGPDGDPELLWALRGGGGNFGVVTEFVYSLHPLGEIHVGPFAVPLTDAAAGLAAVADLVRTAPPELVVFMVGPTTEARVPEGQPAGPREWLRLFCIYHGSRAGAEAAVAPLRALPSLGGGDIVPITYPELQAISGLLPFGLRNYWKGHFVRDLEPAAIEAIVEGLTSTVGEIDFLLIESITGRGRIEPEGGAAFGQREARWNASALAIWEDPAEDEEHIAWVRRVVEGLSPASLSGAGYGNYSAADETADRIRAGFGDERFERLSRVKARYDPDNVFRFNHNIPPAAS